MTLQDYFNSINLDEIDRFISEKQEENTTLEFKTVNHPDYNEQNRDDDKKNISKVLSGFANSNGGITIWGLKAQNNSEGQDVAKEKKPIKELTKFLNLLNRLEGQSVTPTVKGIVHQKIEIADDIGYIKTYVPSSESAPHMANYAGKYYYKRNGDSFYKCEHYDIIDMFSRKKSPKLKILIKVLKKDLIHQVRYKYKILVSIINEGKIIAKLPYLALNFSSHVDSETFGLDGNGGRGLKPVKNNILYRFNYSGGTEIVVYPEAILDVDIFYFEKPVAETPNSLTINSLLTAEGADIIKDKIEIDSSLFLES